mmetsp:Transcript_19104/g.72215  ORF Transcript_19104/g.72215 Transcript_19104/m.72215 type:complete len:224 (-) Transcript_19104:1360-2031(-)
MGLCRSKEDDAESTKPKSKFCGDLYFDERGMLRARPPKDPHFDREVEAQRVFRADSLATDRVGGEELNADGSLPPLGAAEGEEEKKDAEAAGKAEEVVWYIIPSAWLESWVAFIREDRVRPCRIRNEVLLEETDDGAWVQKNGLTAASKLRKGDYRRISEAVWKEFVDLYPGSGPEITVVGKDAEWAIAGNVDVDGDGKSEKKDREAELELSEPASGTTEAES